MKVFDNAFERQSNAYGASIPNANVQNYSDGSAHPRFIFAFPPSRFPFPMSKKLILDIEYDFDFKLWGIATPLRDYQVCLILNKALKTKLSRQDDIELSKPADGKTLLFSVFRYEDEMDKGVFHLMSNRYRGDYLLPEVRQADFLFRFSGLAPDGYLHELHNKLKNIQPFLTVFSLQPDQLKSKMNLLMAE